MLRLKKLLVWFCYRVVLGVWGLALVFAYLRGLRSSFRYFGVIVLKFGGSFLLKIFEHNVQRLNILLYTIKLVFLWIFSVLKIFFWVLWFLEKWRVQVGYWDLLRRVKQVRTKVKVITVELGSYLYFKNFIRVLRIVFFVCSSFVILIFGITLVGFLSFNLTILYGWLFFKWVLMDFVLGVSLWFLVLWLVLRGFMKKWVYIYKLIKVEKMHLSWSIEEFMALKYELIGLIWFINFLVFVIFFVLHFNNQIYKGFLNVDFILIMDKLLIYGVCSICFCMMYTLFHLWLWRGWWQ